MFVDLFIVDVLHADAGTTVIVVELAQALKRAEGGPLVGGAVAAPQQVEAPVEIAGVAFDGGLVQAALAPAIIEEADKPGLKRGGQF